jgi:hypothetical protein
MVPDGSSRRRARLREARARGFAPIPSAGADEIVDTAWAANEAVSSLALFDGGFSAFSAIGYLITHPLIAAALGLATAWLVPLAVDAAWKFLVFPALVLVGAGMAITHPTEAVNFVESVGEEVVNHPEELLIVVAIVVAVSLGPYILGAALVALIISGASVMPSFMRPVLPREIVDASDRVDVFVKEANKEANGGAQALNSFANEVDVKRGELKAQRLARKAAAKRAEDTTTSSAPSVFAASGPRPAVSPREFFDDASGFAKRRIDGAVNSVKSFQNK